MVEIQIMIELFCLFDSDGTVEGNIFFAEVAEAAVVDGSCDLRSGNALFLEFFFNTCNTVFAEADVNLLSTGVVVGPTCKSVVLAGVFFHHVSDSAEDVAVFASEARNADGIVDSSNRAFFNCFFNGTVEAVFKLFFEVSDASVSSSETSAESVAVFGFGANGHNGSDKISFAEVVSYAEVSLNVA